MSFFSWKGTNWSASADWIFHTLTDWIIFFCLNIMFDSKFRGMGKRKRESSVFSSPNSRLARGACTLADQLSKSSSYHDLYLKVDNLNHKVLFLVRSKWFFNWSFFFYAFVRSSLFLPIKDLKQRRFWATHVNRKWGLLPFYMPWR